MAIAVTISNPPLLGSNHKIVSVKQAVNVSIPSVSSKLAYVSLQRRYSPQVFGGRRNNKSSRAVFAAVSGIENVEAPSQFEDFSVTNTTSSSDRELKLRVEVSGAKTQVIFNDVFDKLVATVQPIPVFRREKGVQIPRDILLEILGPSKVYKQAIKNVINSTVAEYVQKNGLKVGKI